MADTRSLASVLLNHRDVVIRSSGELFRYLRCHWGDVYRISRPSHSGDAWRATARFGRQDKLTAASPDELLELIRRHYGPGTDGHTGMLMARPGRKYT